ncbi:hypothetical protein GCM10009756_00550 [Pseudokineococcus marinus]
MKLGNTPDGGGWRFAGRAQGHRNRAATPGEPRSKHHGPLMGTAFVPTVMDNHSRVAYAEIHDDETSATTVGVLARATSWSAAHGERLPMDCLVPAPTENPLSKTRS